MFQLIFNRPTSLRYDILSGLTVALALIPEAIAFAFVAHVDPRVGLYAAFIMGLVTAIVGGRPGMISGATGAVAVIFAPLVIQQTALHGPAVALQYLFLAVIIMGIIQVLFGVLRWGKFVRLIPHPVMMGFVNGLAIIIFKAQFSQFYTGTGAAQTLLPPIPLAVMVGLIALTMAICHYLPRFTKAVPATLVAILTVTCIATLLKQLGVEVYTVLDFIIQIDPSKSTMAASLPHFVMPVVSWSMIKTVLPYACLAAAVGLIESLMTLVLIDELTETRGSGNRESVGQGVANILTGLFGGMGGCAMIGQSMINIRAGGRSRWSGITAAVSLLIFVVFAAGLIEHIPLAALVGVMFMVSLGTFEWSSFRLLSKIPRSDALVIVAVSVITVLVDLAIAVFAGIIIQALVFAWKQGKKITVKTSLLSATEKVYSPSGTLFFASTTSFKALFDVTDDPKNVCIDMSQLRVCDHSALEAINAIKQRYHERGKCVRLTHISAECKGLFEKHA